MHRSWGSTSEHSVTQSGQSVSSVAHLLTPNARQSLYRAVRVPEAVRAKPMSEHLRAAKHNAYRATRDTIDRRDLLLLLHFTHAFGTSCNLPKYVHPTRRLSTAGVLPAPKIETKVRKLVCFFSFLHERTSTAHTCPQPALLAFGHTEFCLGACSRSPTHLATGEREDEAQASSAGYTTAHLPRSMPKLISLSSS